MNAPDQESINHWFANSNKWINHWKEEIIKSEFDQGTYSTISADYAALGRTLFLNDSPLIEVRTAFSQAIKHMIKNFRMAYDKSDLDYLGENADWSEVSETYAIEGFNYALMAADFKLATELARIFQDTLDGYKMDIDVNRYVHALALFLKGKRMDAWGLLQKQMKSYDSKPPKSRGDKNYHTLITTLFGILDKNEAQFNQGLDLQLKLYEADAKGEYKDTDEEFICDHAVALANLGLHNGLKVTAQHDTLPLGLLIDLK